MRNPVKRYNPPKREIDEMMKPMKVWGVIAGLAGLLVCASARGATATSEWDRPCTELADQIAGILGPGQARLTIRNASAISTDEIPAIRRLLEQDLKAHGVQASGAESANAIRVTLSENLRERLWVAEVVEGSETRVAMVSLALEMVAAPSATDKVTLQKQQIWQSHWVSDVDPFRGFQSDDSVLAATVTNNGELVLMEPAFIKIARHGFGGYSVHGANIFELPQLQLQTRDPRGAIQLSADGKNFKAFTSGIQCDGAFAPQVDPSDFKVIGWTVHCHASDDPWPILQTDSTGTAAPLKAFYNAGRDYFTGVVTPSVGVDLPPFYSAALLPRPDGAGLLISGIDGKVQLAESGKLKTVSGTRDWGSDFAALHSGCGAGTQIIASGSGEAMTDSLRAYELPALEALPASAPVAMDGTVTALWSAPDGKSVFAIVRNAAAPGQADEYEVDRVTANCN
jgi:hypothetical protein